MKIKELFNQKTVFSFEVFPPKKTYSIDTIYQTIDELHDLSPDFISVTFSAGGSNNNSFALDLASKVKESGITPMIHLPCINYTKEEISQTLSDIQSRGIENILALRGDINPDIPPKKDFLHASDLIEYIKSKGDAGADHLISQLFFENSYFYEFREKALKSGINVPIEAGIMPVVNKRQIERMVTTCGASLPQKFVKIMQRYEHNPEALRDAGIAYAIDQIVDLLAGGADGIHLYTMNNSYVARKISEAVKGIINV